jgi:hypothetical protein
LKREVEEDGKREDGREEESSERGEEGERGKMVVLREIKGEGKDRGR